MRGRKKREEEEKERKRRERKREDDGREEERAPFPLSPPCTHHFVCDILDVLQPQFLADDIQVSHRVHIPLYVGHIIILKCPWRNHKAETQIPSSPNLQRYTTRDHITIKISAHRNICIGECCASWLQVCLHTILEDK